VIDLAVASALLSAALIDGGSAPSAGSVGAEAGPSALQRELVGLPGFTCVFHDLHVGRPPFSPDEAIVHGWVRPKVLPEEVNPRGGHIHALELPSCEGSSKTGGERLRNAV
jgi:hypothetical protein